jgi:NAD(P)-dependent dehydrogenase (short-subunit alcohol dehydrogenase family)
MREDQAARATNPQIHPTRQVALITSGSSGMGLVTAQAYAEAGAAVILADVVSGVEAQAQTVRDVVGQS